MTLECESMAFCRFSLFASFFSCLSHKFHIQFNALPYRRLAISEWNARGSRKYCTYNRVRFSIICRRFAGEKLSRSLSLSLTHTYLLKVKWLWNFSNAISCFVEVCASRACGVYYPNKISFNHILNTPLEALARIMFLMCRDLWCAPSMPFSPLLFFFSSPFFFVFAVDSFCLLIPRAPKKEFNFHFSMHSAGSGGSPTFFRLPFRVTGDLLQSSICLAARLNASHLIWMS